MSVAGYRIKEAPNKLVLSVSMPCAGSDNIRRTMQSVQVLERYDRWLNGTALATRSRTNYRRWVVELVEDVEASGGLEVFLAPGGGTVGAPR